MMSADPKPENGTSGIGSDTDSIESGTESTEE